MKRLMKAALALLLAMALTLVACDPKVDEPEQRHGEPLWHEEPITVDNAAADIRAFFDEIEEYTFRIDLSPALPILNLVGRPLAQLGDTNKAALEEKLTEAGLTVTWTEDGKLELGETISSSGEVDGVYKSKGDYQMIQDGATGDWSISVSRPDDAKWGCEATLAKDKERDCFFSVKTNRDDPRNTTKNTFYSSVCAYNEVVHVSESVHHSKVTRTVDGEDKEVDRKNAQIITIYFVDKNIGDGDMMQKAEFSCFEDDVKQDAEYFTMTADHDKNGIRVVKYADKMTYPINMNMNTQKMWFPASDGQLQIPKVLRDLGIPSFTVKAGSFFETQQYSLNGTFNVAVDYHDTNEDGKPNKPEEVRFYLYIKEGLDDAKTMVLDAKNKDGQPVFRATVEGEIAYRDFDYVPIAPSPIKGIDIYSDSSENVRVKITLKDDPSTEANELAPFVALAD